MRLLFVFYFLFFSSTLCFAQADARVIVNLDIDAGDFKPEDISKIPFDQSFYIYGSSENKNIKKVFLRYKIMDYVPSKHYYIDSNDRRIDGYVNFGKADVKNGDFKILAPKLHPNENYKFEFTFQENIELPDEKNKQLRLSIVTAIDESLSFKNSNVNSASAKKLAASVSSSIRSATDNKTLFNKKNDTIKDLSNLLVSDPALKISFEKLSTYNGDIFEARKKLLHVNWKTTWDEIVHHILVGFASQEATIVTAAKLAFTDDHYKTQVNTPVNPVVHPSITVKDMLEFLRNDFARSNITLARNATNFPTNYITDIREESQSFILEVLTGNAKIKGNIIEQTDGFNKMSVELMLGALIQFQNLKKADGTTLVPNNAFDTINTYLLKWLEQVNIINENQALIDLEKESNARILKEVYSTFSFKTDADSFVIIDTEKSPYLGIDFGVMVAPDISSTFVYEGINFHLRPVNRKARFRDLKGVDMWLKRTSVSFGVAQRVGSYSDNYKSLVGVGSPFVGIGLRVNRMIRINGGFLFYKVENNHPLVSTTSVESTYFLSASIDIELKNALNIIGNFL